MALVRPGTDDALSGRINASTREWRQFSEGSPSELQAPLGGEQDAGRDDVKPGSSRARAGGGEKR